MVVRGKSIGTHEVDRNIDLSSQGKPTRYKLGTQS